MQRFDNIGTKFLRLFAMSQPPKQGVYGTPDGGIGFAVGGVAVGKVGVPTVFAVNGAVPANASADYVITKAGVLAATLAAPPASPAGDGIVVQISSTTAFAHTLTTAGLLQTGSASVNTATFAAFAGAGLTLMSYNGKWIVIAAVGITFS